MASSPPKGQIYDAVASAYDVIWNIDAGKILFVLLENTLKSLGPWDGAKVLDMACGTGIGGFNASPAVNIEIAACRCSWM
jgi:ubiquinone/menaquinone biosynthesis C-methylase UbiE